MQALQQFTKNPDARWKSSFQELWVREVFEGQQDMLVVARTGGGKSLAYLLPPLVELGLKTVVIQPLRALAMETMEMLKQHGIPAVLISNSNHLELQVRDDTRVLVVSVEAASQIGFYTYVAMAGIKRFIIDEAHQYIDDRSYRTYMDGVARLRGVAGQFVFTTGTLSVAHQDELLRNIFNLVQVKTFRESTVRPEILLEIRDLQVGYSNRLVPLIEEEWKKHWG